MNKDTFYYKNRDIVYVYLLTNDVNGKQYVGISYQPFTRWYNHMHADSTVGKAIRFYGRENFTMEVIDYSDREGALKLEAHYVSELKTLGPVGYNMKAGGFGVVEISDECRYKLGNSSRGKTPWNKGIKGVVKL